MKKIALIFVLLQITLPLAAAGKPNPADFPVKIHVVFSRYVLSAGPYQQIEAVIDGQRVELVGQSNGLLALGDYSARVATDKQLPRSGPRHPNSYDLYKGYELLMADGKTRTYQVTAMGQTEFPVAPLPAAPVVPDTTPAPMATPPPPPPTPPTL